jgi:hypothetical protein
MPITFNRENFERVLNHIKAHPETWKQDTWHCGTSHCFAGHAQIMAGNAPDSSTAQRDARIFLGLTRYEAIRLFAVSRSIADFEAFLSAGYDRDGYDRDGYDRDGYDSAGYNRAGYDSDGLDRDNAPRPA